MVGRRVVWVVGGDARLSARKDVQCLESVDLQQREGVWTRPRLEGTILPNKRPMTKVNPA